MSVRQLIGDCRAILPTLDAASVHCCVTSPPYFGLRDYGTAKWEPIVFAALTVIGTYLVPNVAPASTPAPPAPPAA